MKPSYADEVSVKLGQLDFGDWLVGALAREGKTKGGQDVRRDGERRFSSAALRKKKKKKREKKKMSGASVSTEQPKFQWPMESCSRYVTAGGWAGQCVCVCGEGGEGGGFRRSTLTASMFPLVVTFCLFQQFNDHTWKPSGQC